MPSGASKPWSLRAPARSGFAAVALLAVVLATLAAPASASYVEETESPSPTPSPTATSRPTASASPSPTATASPLPPANDDYWNTINDPEYTPPSPTPSASASPRQRTDRVGPSENPDEPKRFEVEGGNQYPNNGQGRDQGLYSRDAYPPGTFDGGYGLFTPNIDESPITARPDQAPALPPTGSRSTEPILRRLREAGAELDQVARTLAPFPVAGLAKYTAAFTPPSTAPGIATGQGAAIMAEEGTPIVASANGPVTRISPDPAWGTTVELIGPDGTHYRYGRLLRVAPAIQDGMKVTRGQIIGFVGATGTVGGGSYLWFQLMDKAGSVVAPFEYLDRWLKEALTTARVTTGLPAVDAMDDVAAGLLTPEEAGITLDENGQPVSDNDDLSPLETFLSLSFFAFLGWRGWRAWKGRTRRAKPLPTAMAMPEDSAPDITEAGEPETADASTT